MNADLVSPSRNCGGEFDVIEGSVFGAVGAAFDAQDVACFHSDARNEMARGRICVGDSRGEVVVRSIPR